MELRQIMAEYSMNMKELAEHFGIPYRTVQNWCRGERTAPSYIIEMIRRILELEQAQ